MTTTTHPVATPPESDRRPDASSSRRWHRPSINISAAERVGRVVIGLAAIMAGVVLLASPASALAVVLEILFIGVGLDLVVTGALGHCPLYAKLGHVPASLRRSP